MSSFVHLHLHTQYSLLDGMNTIDPLVDTAKRFGMPAIAITDHGNLFGAIEFYQAAKKAGIKPIIGCEVYMAPKTRFDKDGASTHDDDYSASREGRSNPYYHLILLAANEQGYKNLIKLVSIANLEGFYYKPRIDKEVLQKHSAGLIGLSGCLRGEVPYLLNLGLESEAIAAAGAYREIFADRFYIEIQDNGLELQRSVNKQLIVLAKKNSLPIVATNDCHYLNKEDTCAHDIMLCLQTGKTVNTPNRMRFHTDQLYFKSSEEMTAAFVELPEAIHNTLEIADQIDLNLTFGKLHMPNYNPPENITREDYLNLLARAGLSRRMEEPDRFGNRPPLADYEKRLSLELNVIHAAGFSGYFLIVGDIIRYAKNKGIPVGPGRGSAAGSLVAYAMGITDIDPLAYGLLFERFLNLERISPPDIDIDISMDHREEVLEYISQKFGQDHVCQIITFGTMAAKAVIRDVGRVLEIPYGEVDKIAKLVPATLNITLTDALAQEPKLKQMVEENPQRVALMTHAKALEGLVRHASTHAAGVVISAEPLTEYLPLYRASNGEIVTQYTMEDVEKIGLIKFDFLGLKTLTVVDHACRLIREKRQFSLSEIPMDDAETYAYLESGQTLGIFQLESSGMRDVLVKMKPSRFEDLIALLALYRPGPLGSGMVDDFIKQKQGKKKIHYELSEMEPLLKETYGVILYQEQVMKIANVLAGFSLGEADLLRRAMGKKKADVMAAQKVTFIERATAKGISSKKAEKIFDLMEYFSGYGFNKSHSAAYALITYQTAYLKCHFKCEFMAALLTSEKGNSDKIVQYIAECHQMNILILPPDINESEKDFTVVNQGIRFGLAAIKNVGSAAVEAIVAARLEHGRFQSLLDFCQSVDLRRANKRVIEGLLKAGAFDSTKVDRITLLENLEQTMQAAEKYKKSATSTQLSLFGGTGHDELTAPVGRGGPIGGPEQKALVPVVTSGGVNAAEIAKMEKEALGFYITSHPLIPYEAVMKKLNAVSIEALKNVEESDKSVCICGIVGEKKVIRTKKGDPMAYLRLEDLTGSVEVIVFPDLYRTVATLLSEDRPLLIYGTIEHGEHGTKCKATALTLLKKDPSKGEVTKPAEPQKSLMPEAQQHAGAFVIGVSSEKTNPALMTDLKKILTGSSTLTGEALHVYLQVQMPDQSIRIDTNIKLHSTPLLIAKIEMLLGNESVQVEHESFNSTEKS